MSRFFGKIILVIPLLSSFLFAQEIIKDAPKSSIKDEVKEQNEWREIPVVGQDVTTSSSKQFLISGSEPAIRGMVAFMAEELKGELQSLLDDKDSWKAPIYIGLYGRQGDALPKRTLTTSLEYDDSGFKLRVHAHLARGIDRDKFRNQIMTALIYERCLRMMTKGATEERLIVRPWLAEGLTEVIAWKSKRADRKLYEVLFKSGGLYDLEEMLAVTQVQYDEYDSAMRAAFRVSSGALVGALIEQSDGKKSLVNLLSEAAIFGGEMSMLLRKHFSGMNLSKASLEKWWALQMANNSRASLTEVLPVSETEAELIKVLSFRFKNEQGTAISQPIEKWKELMSLKETDRIQSIRQVDQDLSQLGYRCFPDYREILITYQKILKMIITGKHETIDADIATLQEARLILNKRAEMLHDHLDWFEITRARETSGAFEDYKRLKERLDQGIIRNKDTVSDYLDQAQKAYSR
jgi:hypothetical protein